MDSCADGTPADALARMTERYNGSTPPAIQRDIVGIVRQLRARKILEPALAAAG
jgi:hypothetical protein